MAENTKIAWATHTYNHWIGCTQVSAGCVNCYAKDQNERFKWVDRWGALEPRRRASADYRRKPAYWNEKAKRTGVRPRVFALSLGDFLDAEVPSEWLHELLSTVARTPYLDWLLLTKRPENLGDQVLLPNVWYGITAENQETLDKRAPFLIEEAKRRTCSVHFISAEPLLEPLNLRPWLETGLIQWVILGGESGKNHRPMLLEWLTDSILQCREFNVKVFVKQLGGYPDKRDNPLKWYKRFRMQEFPTPRYILKTMDGRNSVWAVHPDYLSPTPPEVSPDNQSESANRTDANE